MNSSQRPDSFEPGDYLAVLRRRWWIPLGLAILCGLAAVAYIKVAPKTYTSTASVYVTATAADTNQVSNGRTSGSVSMDSEAQIVQSITVATIAAHALHTTISPTALLKNVTVTVPANSEVLQISCSEPTADSAAACAQAFAAAYLLNRSTTSANLLKTTLSKLQTQVTQLQHDVAGLIAKVAALPPNSSERATAQARLSSDTSQLRTLNDQVGVITADQANSSAGSIITKATPPKRPTSPQAKLIVPSGIVIGLLLGLILAFWVDRRGQLVRGPGDVQRYLDLPVMLAVPTKQRNPRPTLATPRSRAGQMFAELASSTAAALGEGNHVLVVAGTSVGTGASVAAASLATAFARTHSEVVLVCADLNHSVVPELFGLHRSRGLADVLAGKATVAEVARRPADSPRLRVITPGLDTSLVLSDFQHDVNSRLIAELRRNTSIVIIEAQAAGGSGDTFSLAEFADMALIVVEVGSTKRPEVAETLQRLERLRTPVLGAALVPRFGALATSRVNRESKTVVESKAVAHEAGPAEGHSGPPLQLTKPTKPRPNSAPPGWDPSETRPMPFPAQQALADQRGGAKSSPSRERPEPTGTNGED